MVNGNTKTKPTRNYAQVLISKLLPQRAQRKAEKKVFSPQFSVVSSPFPPNHLTNQLLNCLTAEVAEYIEETTRESCQFSVDSDQ